MSNSSVPVSLSTTSTRRSGAVCRRICLNLAPALLVLVVAPGVLAQASTTPPASQAQATSTSPAASDQARTPAATSGVEAPASATAPTSVAPSGATEAASSAATNTSASTPATAIYAQPAATAAPAQPAEPASAAQPVAPNECKQEWSRSGFYLRGLFTTGYVGMSGTGPNGKPSIDGLGGGSVMAIGGSIAQGLVLAGTLQASQAAGKFKGGPYQGATFTSGEDRLDVSQDATAAFSQIGALIDWYPTQSGFHVGLSGGFNSMAVKLNADGAMLVGTGTSGTLILGYDWPVSRTIAMGISLVGSATSRIKLKYDGEHVSGYELSGKSIGLAGSFLYF